MFLFIAGWTVMTVAMMLPTTMPVLTILHTFARARKDRTLLVGLAVLGYLIAWALFGGVAYLAGILLHEVVSASAFAPAAGGTPVVLLVAGAFQFSSLKHRCLDKCRSPMSFVIGHWRGRRQRWESFRLGWRHGLFCVGCCWALMSLMFVVSSGSLLWMFLLAAIMAVEKNVSWGRRISRPVGVALLAWGTALLIGPQAL
jgi:predicted metal-binding membrane protein